MLADPVYISLIHLITNLTFGLVGAVDEEVGAPLAEVSTAKQLQIVQRVRAIANESLRDSALLKDALCAIVK